MNGRRSRPYLAHSGPPAHAYPEQSDNGDSTAGIEQEDAAEYIAALLGSLRCIAVKAKLRMLSDLLYVAEEEAKLHYRA